MSNNDVEIDLDKVIAMTKWPTPHQYQKVQVFVNFANFYGYFILGYSRLSNLSLLCLRMTYYLSDHLSIKMPLNFSKKLLPQQ
jgi:uncharacterized membrane protein YoaT (DUF817 family)